MPQKSFEEQLRDKTGGFSPSPREGMWDSIEAQLIPEKKKRRVAIFLPLTLAAVLAGIAAIGFYKVTNKTHDNVPVVSSTDPGNIEKKQGNGKMLEPGKQDLAKQDPLIEVDNKGNNALSSAGNKVDKARIRNPKASAGYTDDHSSGKTTPDRIDASMVTKGPDRPAPDKSDIPPAKELADIATSSAGHQNDNSLQDKNEIRTAEISKDSIPANSLVIKPIDTAVKTKTPPTDPPLIKSRWFAEVLFIPTLSASHITIDNNYKDSAPYSSHLEERRTKDKKMWNFGIGIQAGMERSRYRISAGLHYQALSYRIAVRNISNNPSITSQGITPTTFDFNADTFVTTNKTVNYIQKPKYESVEDYVTNRFQYLSIPLAFTYKIKNTRRFNAGLTASLMPQFLLSYEGLLYQEESGYYVKQKIATENHISKMNLSMSGGIDMDYHIGLKSSVFFRPQYGISLFPAEKAAISTSHRFWTFSFGYRRYF